MDTKLPRVQECIDYIESCGWKLDRRGYFYYVFVNPSANEGQREFGFTLKELRHAKRYGW